MPSCFHTAVAAVARRATLQGNALMTLVQCERRCYYRYASR
jgi:hypothetical protein